MTVNSPAKKFLKLSGIVLGIFLALGLGFHLWFNAHAKRMLEDLVSSKSNGKVKMKLGKLRFSYFSNKMELENAVFYNADTLQENTAYRFSVKKINLRVKAFWPVVFQKKFLIDSLTLFEPDIQVTRLRPSDKKGLKKAKDVSIPEEIGKVYNSIRDALKVLKVSRFQIENGKFTLINKIQPDQQPMTISHLNFHIDNFLVDTSNLTAKDKILFSDNIVLSSHDQDIAFPDGRHRLSFSSFSINLQQKLVRFDSCTIAATRDDSSNATFHVYLDALLLTSIDFDTLYRTEVIKADSVYCVNPRFTLEVELGKKKDGGKPPPKLEDIVKQLTGDLELAHVVVSNADFNIKTVRDGIPNSFVFSENNFEMEGLQIDQEAPKSIKVKSFAMAIRNYENFIKDSTYSIQFDSVVLKDDRVTLSNFVFNKLNNGKILNSFSIPQFNLQGLSWDDLVFEKRLKAEQAIMFSPRINYTVGDTKKGRQNIFQSLGAVNDYMDLQYLDVIDGTINLRVNDDLQIQLDSATLAIQSHSLLTSTKLSGIKNSLTRLYFKNGNIRAGNIVIALNNIRYIGNTGQFEAGLIRVTNDETNMNIILQDAGVEKMKVDEVSNNIYAQGVTWKKGEIKINPGAGNKKGVTNPLIIQLHQVQGYNTEVDGLFGKNHITTRFNRIAFTDLEKTPGNRLVLNGLSVRGGQLVVKDRHSELSIADYELADDRNALFQNITYKSKSGNTGIDFRLPSLSLIPHIQPVINGHILLDAVTVTKPIIRVEILPLAEKNLENNDKYPAIDISEINLVQPSIHYTQVSDSGTFSLAWQGEKNGADFLHLAGLHIERAATINTTLKNIRFHLSHFVFADRKGKSFSTGEGKIAAQLRNMDLLLENNLPAEWQAVVSGLDAKDLRLDSLGKKNGSLHLKSAELQELNISSATVLNLQKLASANRSFQITQLSGGYKDADKEFRWYNAAFTRSRNMFMLDSFSYTPSLGKDSFLARQTFQTDYLTLKTGAIRIGPVNLDRYISDNMLIAGTLSINDVVMTDYKDKRLPLRENLVKPLPATMIKNIPLKLSLDSLLLINTNIEYTEVNPKTNSAAIIPVTRLNAKIFPVRNYGLSDTDSLNIQAEAYLLDSVWLRLRVKESYLDSLQGFLMTLRMKPIDLRLLNPMLVPASSVKIVSGYLDTLNLRAVGREFLSFGETQMYYHDLKIKLLKGGDEKKTGSGLLNFIINNFIVKNKNTSRTGTAFYIRNRQRSAINYLLRIALSGISSSVGAKSNRKLLRQYEKEIRQRKLPPVEL